jgi:hypothetical protein
VDLERGTLSFVSTTEELLARKSSGCGLGIREYGCRDPSHWPCCTLYPKKLALNSPTSGGRSVGIVRSRTQVTDQENNEIFMYMKRGLNIWHYFSDWGVHVVSMLLFFIRMKVNNFWK